MDRFIKKVRQYLEEKYRFKLVDIKLLKDITDNFSNEIDCTMVINCYEEELFFGIRFSTQKDFYKKLDRLCKKVIYNHEKLGGNNE